MTSQEYFDQLYADNPDPWNLGTSGYEQQKLDLMMAALGKRRYHNGFEPGCAIGITTAAFAERCDRLLALDCAAAAVAQTRQRIEPGNVVVAQGRIPSDWPTGSFDLIVLSELLYYLDAIDRLTVAELAINSITPGGDVLAVHWRHPFSEAPADGQRVHVELAHRFHEGGMTLVVDHADDAFLLQLYRAEVGL